MKKIFFLAIAVIVTASVQAQKGNPLKNIPVTDQTGILEQAKISIDDFDVIGNEIIVTSTLSGLFQGTPIEPQTVTYPIDIISSSCSHLMLSPGAIISADYANIGGYVVTLTPDDVKDKQLNRALCEIAELNIKGGSSYVIVAKIKQAVRALL